MVKALNTVVETVAYLAQASRIFDEDERAEIAYAIAMNPEAGDVIVGTGGVRKLRIARGSRGKSAGARVVYYFHSDRIPAYLIGCFTKTERDALSNAEKNALSKFVEETKARLK